MRSSTNTLAFRYPALLLSALATLALSAQWIGGSNPANMFAGTTGAMVGTGIITVATLRVRGDQIPVADVFATSLCTFRTDVLDGVNQNWSMTRFRPSLNAFDEIGRLWHTNPDNTFNIGSRQADGNLWLHKPELLMTC